LAPETETEQEWRERVDSARAERAAAEEAGRRAEEAKRKAEEAVATAELIAKRDAEREIAAEKAAEKAKRDAEEEKRLAPIRAEAEAARKLKLIKELYDLLDITDAKARGRIQTRLEALVKDHPKTKAAGEARELLKKLGS